MDERPKRKRNNWSEADEIRLLGIWEENVKELKKTRRNSHIYARMADHFADHTPEEVHIKISNFTQRYRSEKKAIEAPGSGPSAWKYFAIVDRILGPMRNGEGREDRENGDNDDFEGLPEGFTFKEEASSEMTSYASSSPPPNLQPLLKQLEAAVPSLRIPLLMPPCLSESQDSPTSSIIATGSQPVAKRKKNRGALQKEALKIARENQNLLREQIAFSREAIKEQLNLIAHSIELIKESTENSKHFSTKICEISERQLELENNFMRFMKEMLSKKSKRKRKNRT